MKKTFVLALALATLPHAAVLAQSTIEAPPGSGVRLPLFVQADPSTGKAIGASTSAGYTGATATAPGTNGTTATPVQGVDGGKAVAVSGTFFQPIQPVSGTVTASQATGTTYAVSWTGQTVQLGAGSAAIGTVSVSNFPTTQAISGTVTANLGTLNGAALDTSVQAVKTALGSPFQAGGSIGNTGFNALQGGAANSATNQFFEQTVGPSMQAPGTAASIARAVQRADGKAIFTSGDTAVLGAGTALVGKFGIDQTTPGTTNKVSIGSDGVVGQGPAGASPWPVYADCTVHTFPLTYSEGQTIPLSCESFGRLVGAEGGSPDARVGITPVSAFGANSLAVRNVASNLYHFEVMNATATLGYVVEYNATAAPAANSALTNSLILGCHLLPASGVYDPARNPGPPKAFSTGIVLLISSTSCAGTSVTYTTGTVTAQIEAEAR